MVCDLGCVKGIVDRGSMILTILRCCIGTYRPNHKHEKCDCSGPLASNLNHTPHDAPQHPEATTSPWSDGAFFDAMFLIELYVDGGGMSGVGCWTRNQACRMN